MNIVVIAVNPHSGSGSRRELIQRLERRLTERGYGVQVESDIETIVQRVGDVLAAGQLQSVVSAGGDGTAGLLVNRLPPETPLAILPLGTENLLAKHLGIRGDIDQLVDMIERRRTLQLDVGSANGRLFLIMASCGFDADVVERMGKRRRGHIGHLSYLRPIWEAIWKYPYAKLQIRVDGEPIDIQPRWSFVFNIPRYAMNLPLVPEADGFDGWLDMRTFEKGSLWNGLGYLTAVILRRHRSSPETRYYRARRFRIESQQRVPYQLDGDPGGLLPLEIGVVPGRFKVVVPEPYWLSRQPGRAEPATVEKMG